MDDECDVLRMSKVKDGIIDVDEYGILVRIAPLDGSRQIVVPWSLRPCLLWLEHFPVVAAHPGVSKMYAAMRRRFYWRNMHKEVEETVRHYTVCAKNRVKERKRTSFLKLFPASGPLEFVAMDILGPLPKPEHGNRFLLVISDRFSKLTRTVPMRTITTLCVAKAFCDAWVLSYGPPRYLLTDNVTQFNAKFFLSVCRELGIFKIFTTAYHPQTNGQVERFNRTIINCLRGYIERRQTDWDEYTSAITFGYNCRVHSSLDLAPFELILSRPPPTLSVRPSEAEVQDTPASAKLRFITRVKELVPLAQTRLAEAQAQYKKNFDRSIKEKNKELLSGSWVYLRREVHEAGRNPNLDDQVDGPYKAIETDGRVSKLRIGDEDVPVSSDRITPAPVSDPEPRNREYPIDETARPVAAGEDDEEEGYEGSQMYEFVFERITGMKKLNDRPLRYKVRRYGYGPEDDTWEPRAHLPAASLRRYHCRIEWTSSK
jgi:Integrase zinc binding domain